MNEYDIIDQAIINTKTGKVPEIKWELIDRYKKKKEDNRILYFSLIIINMIIFIDILR
tara:strand:+ start:46 stop:219 length:174 start_codon:yes stop_codon:yes gene_type:complete